MKSLLLILMATASLAVAAEIKPMSYEAKTNMVELIRHVGSDIKRNVIITETTNVPGRIVHAVTFGDGKKKLFTMKTSEVLEIDMLNSTNGGSWNQSGFIWYNNAAWVEGVK